jgi:DNA gyrase/topoisomerase IV subunit B
VEIRLADLRTEERRQYWYSNGVADLAALLASGRELLYPAIRIEHQAEWGDLSVGLQYHSGWDGGELLSFANHYPTEDGSHARAFRLALVDAVNAAVQESPYPLQTPGAGRLGWPDVSPSLCAVVSVRLSSPLWEGPMRGYLGNRELTEPFRKAIAAGLERSRHEMPRLWSEFSSKAASSAEWRPRRERTLRVIRRSR